MKNLHAILALCSAKVINDAIVSYIFPYIAELLLTIGLESSRVPKFSGLAESIMSLVNVVTIPLWARMMDHTSHRNLLLWSLLLSCLISSIFGTATQVWQILALRGLLGTVEKMGLLGSVMMGEISAEEDRARAFAWNGTATFMGEALGVWIGGYFALPAGRIPVLGRIKLFESYPFVLPSMVIASLCLVVLSTVYLFIPKINPSQIATADVENEGERGSLLPPTVGQESGYRALAKDGSFVHLVASNFFHKLSYHGTLALISTAGHLPTSVGGVGMTVFDLGRLLNLTQIVCIVYLMFVYPTLFQRLTNRSMMILASAGWLTCAAFFPLANLVFSMKNSSILRIGALGLWVFARALGVTIYPTAQVLRSALYQSGPGASRAVAVFGIATQASNVLGAALYGWSFGLSSSYPQQTMGRWISPSLSISLAFVCLLLAVFQRQIVPRPRANGTEE